LLHGTADHLSYRHRMGDLSSSTHRIAVAGGSLGGLFAAAMLHRLGHDVTVHEKSVHGLRARGAGLVAQDEIFTALDAAGVPPAAVPGVTSAERITLDRRGAIRSRERAEQTQLSWDRLYDGLRGVIPDARYLLDSAVTGVRTGVDGVEFTAGGEQRQADLLVGADGAHSSVRSFVAPDGGGPAYVGYAIWRGLIPEDLVPPAAAATLFRRMTFYTGPGEHALGYLVPGPAGETRPGSRRYNWVWYRSMSHDELRGLMSSAGRSAGSTSLAPVRRPRMSPHTSLQRPIIVCRRSLLRWSRWSAHSHASASFVVHRYRTGHVRGATARCRQRHRTVRRAARRATASMTSRRPTAPG